MSWRDSARPIIAKVLKDTEHKTPAERKRALFEAYPFGMRKYTPYKIWLDEIKRQKEHEGCFEAPVLNIGLFEGVE